MTSPTTFSWPEELLKQVETAAAAAGEAAAEEVWSTAVFAANNASRRLQSNIALDSKTQAEQLVVLSPRPSSASPPPPPTPPSPPPHVAQEKRRAFPIRNEPEFNPLRKNHYSPHAVTFFDGRPQYTAPFVHPVHRSSQVHLEHVYPHSCFQKTNRSGFIQKLSDRFRL